jgi:hypothetical protein
MIRKAVIYMDKQLLIAFLSVIVISSYSQVIADTIITNDNMGISTYLPDNWVAYPENDSNVFLYDTTYMYTSYIAIKKYTRNTNDYPTSADWVRAHFIAYIFVTEYSWDPFGSVLYFDSSSTCMQDSNWACEAFSEFYTIDTSLGSWDEYIRYTAAGNYGYEIYAIGDTSDMKTNIGTYMAIIRLISINGSSSQSVIPGRITTPVARIIQSSDFTYGYNVLGRKIPVKRYLPNGAYIRPLSAKLFIELR